MQNTKKIAFTLVELIVVITILAILGTIAFISLSGYSAVSRDSVRLSDASSMRTSLEIYQVNSGKYPLPDQNGYFTLDSETLWWQGKFNGTVIDNLSRNFSEAPQDPISEKTYTYSVAGNKNEYQLLVLLEGDENALNTFNQTNAATQSRTPKIIGTYNGLYVKTATKFVALPSIISSLDYTQGANTLTGSMMTSLVVNGYDNVPNEGNIKYVTGALDIPEIVYSTGTVIGTDGDSSKASVVRMLQNAYSGSNLSNDGIVKYIVDLDSNDDALLSSVLDTVVLGNAADVVSTDTSCNGTPSGQTKDFFSTGSVSAGGNCNTVKTTFTCDNTVWKDGGVEADIVTYSYGLCSVANDTQAPTGGSMVINNNDATTSSTSVTLNITCPTDAAGSTPIEIAYGNTPNPSNWTACTSSISHSLTSGDGTKTVYYKFRDSALNETTENSDSITFSSAVDGSCGSSDASCVSGSVINLSGGTGYGDMRTWNCTGTNGGSNSSCSYNYPCHPNYGQVCGTQPGYCVNACVISCGGCSGSNKAYHNGSAWTCVTSGSYHRDCATPPPTNKYYSCNGSC